MDKKKRKSREEKREHKILVLGLGFRVELLFFHNLHKFGNTGKTFFFEEFSFFAWLV